MKNQWSFEITAGTTWTDSTCYIYLNNPMGLGFDVNVIDLIYGVPKSPTRSAVLYGPVPPVPEFSTIPWSSTSITPTISMRSTQDHQQRLPNRTWFLGRHPGQSLLGTTAERDPHRRLWESILAYILRIEFALNTDILDPAAFDALSTALLEWVVLFSLTIMDCGECSLRPLEI